MKAARNQGLPSQCPFPHLAGSGVSNPTAAGTSSCTCCAAKTPHQDVSRLKFTVEQWHTPQTKQNKPPGSRERETHVPCKLLLQQNCGMKVSA